MEKICKGINSLEEGSFYAHSIEGESDKSQWQLLEDHLQAVAKMAGYFAEDFDSQKWAYIAGTWHDIGKYQASFQSKLEGVIVRVKHSGVGGILAEEFLNKPKKPLGRILSYLIMGHHAGLPDYYPCEGGGGSLQMRLENESELLDCVPAKAREMDPSLLPSTMPDFINKDNFHFWIRMLFSCLVDADFLDTEAFMDSEKSKARNTKASICILKEKLDKHMKKLIDNATTTLVNEARAEILDACRTAANEEPGLFSLTVPTGGGKTLAAMSFALDHAVLHKKNRIIYVIPYTSIIEQTAEILGDIFGKENIIEHHSNLAPEGDTLQNRLASENWDAPIIVTTNVQFFESLYAARTSRCRKLHNIVNSVVILDEAQMVPPNLLTPCVRVINELIRNYKVSFVLSTATQPALPNLDNAKEIISEALNLYERLKRTDITIPDLSDEKISWEFLAQKLQKYDQVLCIVNTRRDCYDLFQLMPEETIHLSALMCGEHRSKVIKSIKERLERGEPIRVISTQLVEAGVDIDFPVVYRALSGLDSIAQAAGRCNREGKLKEKGQVIIFRPPNNSPPGLLRKGEDTTSELRILENFDPQSPDCFTQYFELFYTHINDTGEENMKKHLTPDDPTVLDMGFRTYGNNFRLIDDRSRRPVIVQYGENEKLIEELKYRGPKRNLMRKLQRFTVNLPNWKTAQMKEDGLLYEPWENILAQSRPSSYNDLIGLDIFLDVLPVDDLIC